MNKDFASDALRRLLGRRMPAWALGLLGALATAVFAVFAWHARYAGMDDFPEYRLEEMLRITTVMLSALFALSAAVQLRAARKLPLSTLLLLMAATGAVLLGKISLFDMASDDYDIFLSSWIYEYSKLGFVEGLGAYVGSDYGPPYLYFLQIISRFKDYPWQYMVRVVSMAFEVLLGYGVMKLVSLRTKSIRTQLLMYHIVQLLPTVVYNGARWGQCDVIYTSFAVLALYMAMKKRSAMSMLFFGFSLAFKLQVVFVLPALLALWLRGDIKLRHLPLIPAGYMLVMLPALMGGKSLNHVLTVYLQQAGHYNLITVNAQNLYELLLDSGLSTGALYQMLGTMAMVLGFGMLLFVCAVLIANRDRLTDEVLLLSTILIAEGVPFFLPKMHERYTFAGGVLSVVLLVYHPKYAALPLLLDFAAYICYTAGLPGATVLPIRFSTMFQFAALCALGAALALALRKAGTDATMEVKAR